MATILIGAAVIGAMVLAAWKTWKNHKSGGCGCGCGGCSGCAGCSLGPGDRKTARK